MISIRSYFVFIILVIGNVLADVVFPLMEQHNFFNDIVDEHNKYRIVHGANGLLWSANMFRIADYEVENCIRKDHLLTSDDYGVTCVSIGVNKVHRLDSKLAKKIVDGCYQTSSHYNYNQEPSSKAADAFTRIVWKDTQKISVALAVNDNRLYIVFVYSPAGNKKNDYLANVGEPQVIMDEEFKIEDYGF